jgi:hypothetical protein
MLPAMHPPSGQAPTTFTPSLWADHALDTFNHSSLFSPQLGNPLSPSDLWQNEPYEEAVAFARILKITVIVTERRTVPQFYLSVAQRSPVTIAQCSPTELIAALRAYASGTLVGRRRRHLPKLPQLP